MTGWEISHAGNARIYLASAVGILSVRTACVSLTWDLMRIA